MIAGAIDEADEDRLADSQRTTAAEEPVLTVTVTSAGVDTAPSVANPLNVYAPGTLKLAVVSALPSTMGELLGVNVTLPPTGPLYLIQSTVSCGARTRAPARAPCGPAGLGLGPPVTNAVIVTLFGNVIV
jgi:hypothetical protein